MVEVERKNVGQVNKADKDTSSLNLSNQHSFNRSSAVPSLNSSNSHSSSLASPNVLLQNLTKDLTSKDIDLETPAASPAEVKSIPANPSSSLDQPSSSSVGDSATSVDGPMLGITDVDGVTRAKRKRGRLVGNRKKSTWKKQGRPPRKQDKDSAKEDMKEIANMRSGKRQKRRREAKEMQSAYNKIIHAFCAEASANGSVVGDDETIEEVHVYVTGKEALQSPERTEWLKAIEKERLELAAFKTWQPLTQEQWNSVDKSEIAVVPAALVLTRKRDLSFKCRCAALGNRMRTTEECECFSPSVSMAAQWLALCKTASDGYFLKCLDLESAFLSAVLDQQKYGRVYVKIPEIYLAKGMISYARLLRTLYGLDFSPREWWSLFDASSSGWGWEVCEGQPGLCQQPSEMRGKELVLTVHVDDCALSGPISDEVDRELQATA
jgi:hypothetical protein